MFKWLGLLIRTPVRFHAWGSLFIVLFATMVISAQVADRRGFANGELYDDVMDRWGTPIDQPAPSVRYVESGTVFNALKPLVLERQRIEVDSEMNYRKRGLVYFSGFDFSFSGGYEVVNPEDRDIDIVFVFPVSLDRNKVLLSELEFAVNGGPAPVEMSEGSDYFVWTGRLAGGEAARFDVRFSGRGLDAFTYRLDPAFAVRNFELVMRIQGGDNFDYPPGVVPAHDVARQGGTLQMTWAYPSLESGVPVGALLPSEKSFDELITTMARRSWAPFLLFFAGVAMVVTAAGKSLRFYDAYLIASGYGFFFVLLAYLAAFTSFYLAFVVSSALMVGLMAAHVGRLISAEAARVTAGLLAAFLVLPCVAVIAQGFTGLIYSLEILAGLAALMHLTTRDGFQGLIERVAIAEPEVSHGA